MVEDELLSSLRLAHKFTVLFVENLGKYSQSSHSGYSVWSELVGSGRIQECSEILLFNGCSQCMMEGKVMEGNSKQVGRLTC